MKKNVLLLLLPLVFASVSCNRPTTSVNSLTEPSSAPIVSEEVEIATKEYEYTEIRKSTYIIKDNVTYYDEYSIKYYDEEKALEYDLLTITKYNDFSSPKLQSTTRQEVYYDGLYSYTLKQDDMFYKEKNPIKVQKFKVGYNFELLDNLEVVTERNNKVVKGTVSDINRFFNKEKKNITKVDVSITLTGNRVSKYNLKYAIDEFEVEEEIKVGQFSINLALPNNVIAK